MNIELPQFNNDVEKYIPYLNFLKGKMKPAEAENFVNECLDDPEKLKTLIQLKEGYDFISKAFKEISEKESIKNLLKDIYGISLDNKEN